MIELILYGGLGNQLFQYACARSLQLESKNEPLIINTYLFNNYQFKPTLVHFNIPDNIIFKNKPRNFIRVIAEASRILGHNKLYELLCPFGILVWRLNKYKEIELKTQDNYLYGYFQAEQFFEKHSIQIKNELKIKHAPLDSIYYNRILNSNSVCIHIRRGDYIKNNMIICDLSYYYKAVEIIKNRIDNPTFFVFSDDIEWVKNNLLINGIVYVDEKNKDCNELALMYSCQHFIISNSTFSWWGQYLSNNQNKVVIAPSKWMPYDKEKRDIYQKNWILI